MLINADRLRSLLHYDPDTGVFTRLRKTRRARNDAPLCGCIEYTIRGKPYLRVRVDGERYSAHRLAWLYMTGEWPASDVDHKDTDGLNNRWNNLRLASVSQNRANTKRCAANSSGFKGVSWVPRDNKFCARIKINGKPIHLGYRKTAEEAHQLYCEAARKYFGEFARVA